MDRRKILEEKEKTIYETLNSDDLNLELAQNIEHLLELKEIIKFKANQSFVETNEKNKSFTIFSRTISLEDKPRSWYIISFFVWWFLYKRKGKIKLVNNIKLYSCW